MLATKAKGGVFYGWWIVLVCAVMHLYTGGTYTYGFTAFFNPIVEEFGWKYAIVSLASTLRGFEFGIMAPIVGVFTDKWGPRPMLLCGIAMFGLGLFLLGNIHSLSSFYVAAAVVGLGASLVSAVGSCYTVTYFRLT